MMNHDSKPRDLKPPRNNARPSARGVPPTAKGASNANQHPDEWVTGDAPMTAGQASFLQSLSEEAGESFDADLSKAGASMRIEVLQKKAGRGHPKQILEEDQTDG